MWSGPGLVWLGTYVLAGLAGIYGLYRGAEALLESHILHVDRIVVHGNQRLADADVMAILTGLHGESLVSADLDEWRQQRERLFCEYDRFPAARTPAPAKRAIV